MTMSTNAGSGSGNDELKYKGVRKRKWGKWVTEVRLPNSRERIWLGSYDSPKKAARAFDAAAYCLRGRRARLNFPNNPPQVPAARSLSHQQIQAAAARHAHSVPESETTTVTTTTEVNSPSETETTTVTATTEVNSPSEMSEVATLAVATTDWSFLDFMTEGFSVMDDFYYDFMPPPAGPAADMAAVEEVGNSFLWNF